MPDRIVCDVLTGFLGSGKTTLLNTFLKQEPNDVAVIVNEFGSIGIDQITLQQVAQDVYLLDSGCLCCSITHSLTETLLEIKNFQSSARRPQLRRVIVETSGLADPVPILHVLLGEKIITDYFNLGNVITTLDALHGVGQLRNHIEALHQVALAEVLVITKVDQADQECRSAVKRELRFINPTAPIGESANGDAAPWIFLPITPRDDGSDILRSATPFRLRSFESQASRTTGGQHVIPHAKITSWSEYYEGKLTWVGVSAWWNLLVHKYGDSLLRCKGLLRLCEPDQYVVIQGVRKVFYSPQPLERWPDRDPRSRLVCIGIDLDPSWLSESLRAMAISEPSYRPTNLAELNECL